MALTFPRTMVAGQIFRFSPWRLIYEQEISRTPVAVQVRDLGPARWTASYKTVPISYEAAEDYFAEMQSLDGSERTFYAFPFDRQRPQAFPTGSISGVSVAAIASNRRGISLTGLPPGIILSRGDYFAVPSVNAGREFFQLAESVIADGAGLTPVAEIRPYVRPTVTVGKSAVLIRPLAEMQLDEDSLDIRETTGGNAEVSFSCTQVIR